MKKNVSFASKLENISIVEKMVDELSDVYKLDTVLYGNILVSLVEAVSNAIKHGNRLDDQKMVTVSCDIVNNLLVWSVTDEGIGFDYTSLPDPTSFDNIDKPNGRGVFLITRLADEVEFKDNGRYVEIRFDMKNPKM